MTETAGQPAAPHADPADLAARATPPGPVGLSIHAFLTDGSLTMLCRELSRFTGFGIELRDEHDRLIIPVDPPGPAGLTDAAVPTAPRHDAPLPWAVIPAVDVPPVPPDADRLPLRIDDTVIGTIVLAPGGPPNTDPEARESVRRALELLASTGSELCRDVLEMRHRLKELAVLYRLSALLAARTPIDAMLSAALDSAVNALDLSAGSIVLLPEDADGVPVSNDEADLETVASTGLSAGWLNSPVPLSRGRLFDRIALAGDVLVVDDLTADARVMQPERVADEGLRSFIISPMIVHKRPIGLIRLYTRAPRRFSETERRLVRSIGDQAAAAVEQARLVFAQKAERRVQRQLQLASQVQSRMLPRRLPERPGLDIAGRSLASYELAGDFYDVFELGESLGVVIGDVVGKGVAAALLMSAVRASLRAHVQNVYNLDDVIERVNRAMCEDTLDNEFATLWYGVVDPHTRVLSYASAGHDPPFVIRPPHDGGPPTHESVRPLGVGGLVLGVDPAQRYQRSTHQLERGDVLVALTDGITDARNYENERFGWNRLVESVLDTLRDAPDATATHILEQVFWNLRRFAGLRKQVDDETLVVLRVD